MPFEDVRGIRIYYERSGKGHPLLFFNGSGGDLRQKPGPMEGPLPEHFDLLAHDQRGLGRSEKPDTPYTMGDYADDAAALLDVIGWERCRVMGVSFGGMVAQEFAVRYPQRVERLVLCCTSSGGAGQPSYPLHQLAELSEEDRAVRSIELADTRMNAEWRRRHPDEFAGIVKLMTGRRAIGAADPHAEMGARRQLEARRLHDVFNRLPRLDMPVLVCAGRHDAIAPVANSEAIAGQIPNARLEVFEGGHLFLIQDPKANECIIDFLR